MHIRNNVARVNVKRILIVKEYFAFSTSRSIHYFLSITKQYLHIYCFLLLERAIRVRC